MNLINPNFISFVILALIAVGASLGVVFCKNPVRSAICLVISFCVLAVLYFTLSAEMLGITQIVVYAGAIMVLFLFVVMLLTTANQESLNPKLDWRLILASLFAVGLIAVIGFRALLPFNQTITPRAPDGYGGPQELGMALFTRFGYPFEAISLLLMVGIVGSILLAKRRVR